MYDAVTPGNVPADAQMVAGYIDGYYRSYNALVARCPNATHVAIAVHPSTNDGIVLDVERGDATPDEAPGWVTMRRAAGVDPSVYCSLAFWDQVKAAFRAQKVAEPHYWIAAYPGNGPNLYPGAVAHQYTDYQGLYDISAVADYWPGVDGPGQPAINDEEIDMSVLVRATDDPTGAVILAGIGTTGTLVWLSDPNGAYATEVGLRTFGHKDATVHSFTKQQLHGYVWVGPVPPGF